MATTIIPPLPSTLLNGTPNDATQVMQDLNWIVNYVNANAGGFAGTVTALPQRELQTAVTGQTLFILATISYTVGVHALTVIVNGRVIPESDYTQTSSTLVTFNTALLGGEQVEFMSNSFSAFGSSKVNVTDSGATSTDVGSFQFKRNVNYSGGTPGFVNACVRADTYVNNAGTADFEWAVVGVVHNQATAGENVGGYFQGIKFAGAGPTWGATCEIIDQSVSNPTTGVVGLEVDVTADGTDANTARIGVDIVWRNRTATGMHAAYGLRLNGSDTNATVDIGIGATTGAKMGIGIDLSSAAITGAAINLSTNQAINLGGNAGVPANTRQVYHNGNGYLFQNSAGTTYWALNDVGSLVVRGTQLLGAQQTVTGSRSGGAALQNLLTKLALHGLIIDSTTA